MDALIMLATTAIGTPILALFGLVPVLVVVGAIWTRREAVRSELRVDVRRAELRPPQVG